MSLIPVTHVKDPDLLLAPSFSPSTALAFVGIWEQTCRWALSLCLRICLEF